ncbi:MAG: hypothetical protein GC200_00325 [Tepidisphaera sp.]|nr:hypothetical protein [Tepidisphaera sp.]
MLPKGYKVGSVTPPAPRGPSVASVVGGKVASGAKAVGNAAASGAKATGSAIASGAKGAAHTVGVLAKHPTAVVKGPAAAVGNAYRNTFNSPTKDGVKDTMKSNFQRAPIKSTVKVAAGVTGAMVPLAAAKGLAKPVNAITTQRLMKQDAAEKKMGGLSWTPPTGPKTRPRG